MKIRRGGLYLADLNPRFGTGAGKNRPIVVIQNDLLKEVGHPSTWVLPCTTSVVPDNILRVSLPRGIAGNSRECQVMIDQSRTIDTNRLIKHLGPIPKIILKEIERKLLACAGFSQLR